MGGKLNWERENRNRKVRERGGEPFWLDLDTRDSLAVPTMSRKRRRRSPHTGRERLATFPAKRTSF
jgi:hypothetical protein